MHTYKHICISTCIHICTYALIYFLSVLPASYRMTTRRRVLATRKALRTSKVFRTFLIHFSSADYLSTFVHICFFTISTAKVLCADFCSLHGFFFFCIYTYTCTQTYLHAYTRIRLHIYIHIHLHTHIHIHIHIHSVNLVCGETSSHQKLVWCIWVHVYMLFPYLLHVYGHMHEHVPTHAGTVIDQDQNMLYKYAGVNVSWFLRHDSVSS